MIISLNKDEIEGIVRAAISSMVGINREVQEIKFLCSSGGYLYQVDIDVSGSGEINTPTAGTITHREFGDLDNVPF